MDFKARVITAHETDGQAEPIGLYSLTLVLEKERDMRKALDVNRWTLNGMFPALNLEFLGVCEPFKKQGLGGLLMMDAITTFSHLAEKAGIPILTLYPLKKDLVPYYRDRNFLPYGPGDGMMMSAETAIKLRDGG